MTKNVEAVVFDWAGTTVDFGSFAPVRSFVEVFRQKGIEITTEEARKPMGLLKIDHTRELLRMERISGLWVKQFGKEADEQDVKNLYSAFKPMLLEVLKNDKRFSTPVPGMVELLEKLRAKGIKVGSTTGYTREMIDIVASQAREHGYKSDSIVTSDEVPSGRPYPWMCYQTAINLEVYPFEQMVKVGDTVTDIEEGVNAGMWSVGILKGGSELGLSEQEVKEMDAETLAEKMKDAAGRFKQAGAHFVIEDIAELDSVIEHINNHLQKGQGDYVYAK